MTDDRSTRKLDTEKILFLYVVPVCFLLLYFPTLSFGYHADDFGLVRSSFGQWVKDPLTQHGRPVWSLSYLLINMLTDSSFVHHFVNISLFAIIAHLGMKLTYRYKMRQVARFVLLAALSHPSFVWPVTWIANRNDLLLLVFVFTGLNTPCQWCKLITYGLSGLAKSPFVFHNVLFSTNFIKTRRPAMILGGILLIALIPFTLYATYQSYFSVNQAAGKAGLYLLSNDSSGYWLMFVAFRAIKILEAIVYVFVPFSAYAVSPTIMLLSGIAISALWLVTLVSGISLSIIRTTLKN